jgi:hypothetical protein
MFENTYIQHVDQVPWCQSGSNGYLQTTSGKSAIKIGARVNLIQKLAGTNWGSDAQTLQTALLALVYSTAKYRAPVWMNSVHTNRVNITLNNAMRLIFGTLKSTQLPWLPVLPNIEPPPKLRSKTAAVRECVRCRRHYNICRINNRSRKPIWTIDPGGDKLN